MPYVLGFLIAAGVFTGIAGKKKLLAVWVVIFLIAGAAGGVDFYMWEYDYGHNLDPTAAIIVPGMSYQPPLIGSTQLLNFVATSLPDTGGIIIMATGLIGVLALIYESWFGRKKAVKLIENKMTSKSDPIKENTYEYEMA
jgi:copper chaperone NosL